MDENPYQAPAVSQRPKAPRNYRSLTNWYCIATLVLIGLAQTLASDLAVRQMRPPTPGSELPTLLLRAVAILSVSGAIYCFIAASVFKYRDWRRANPKSANHS